MPLSAGAIANFANIRNDRLAGEREQNDRARQGLMSIATGLGKGLSAGYGMAVENQNEAAQKEQLRQALVSEGLPEALMNAGPEAVTRAIMEKRNQQAQMDRDVANRAHDFQMGQQKIDAEAADRAREQGAWSAGMAPIKGQGSFQVNPAVPAATWPTQRDPTAMEAARSYGAAGGSNMPDFALAFDRMRKPPENPMAGVDQDIEKERRLKAEGLGRYTSEPSTQKPWQPMTREDQLAFAKDKAEATRPPEASETGRFTDPQRARATLVRSRINQINQELANGDKVISAMGRDPNALRTELAALQEEYNRLAPVVGPVQGGSQPPGDPAKVKALQDAGKKWDGTRWLNADGSPM